MSKQEGYVIHASAIYKTYMSGDSQLQVLSGLDFTLEDGKSAVIIGKSGSGKSTLLHLLGALDTADSGSIVASQQRLETLSERQLNQFRRDRVGFIFQSHYLLNDFTAYENVYLPALMSGRPKRSTKQAAAELIEQVGLSERSHHYPSKLSGGERQRVAVARALINDPDIVLADEPTGNLDEYNSRIIEDLLFNLVETYKKSLVLVTHDAALIARGEKTFRLFLGKLEAIRP